MRLACAGQTNPLQTVIERVGLLWPFLPGRAQRTERWTSRKRAAQCIEILLKKATVEGGIVHQPNIRTRQ